LSGRLDNSGEPIELEFPDQPELDGFVPYVMVEKVSYQPGAPWPGTAAGTGQSLQRAILLAYGNDPISWFAATPTAGALSPSTSNDVDGDGVPDVWEMLHGTDPFVPDGTADPDGDRFNNYSEWLAGTNPQDAASCLKLEAVASGPGVITLRFDAKADRSYSILKAGAPDSTWLALTNVPAAPSNRLFSVDQPIGGMQFFRIVTPAQP
jgi:hypothetical protein